MKSALFFLAAFVLAPVALLLTLGVTAAFSFAVAASLITIAVADYGHTSSDYVPANSPLVVVGSHGERLRLAA